MNVVNKNNFQPRGHIDVPNQKISIVYVGKNQFVQEEKFLLLKSNPREI